MSSSKLLPLSRLKTSTQVLSHNHYLIKESSKEPKITLGFPILLLLSSRCFLFWKRKKISHGWNPYIMQLLCLQFIKQLSSLRVFHEFVFYICNTLQLSKKKKKVCDACSDLFWRALSGFFCCKHSSVFVQFYKFHIECKRYTITNNMCCWQNEKYFPHHFSLSSSRWISFNKLCYRLEAHKII